MRIRFFHDAALELAEQYYNELIKNGVDKDEADELRNKKFRELHHNGIILCEEKCNNNVFAVSNNAG